MFVVQRVNLFVRTKGISVKALSEGTGISFPTLRDALKRDDMKVSMLKKIADFLKVDVCEFFKEEVKGKPYKMGEEKHELNDGAVEYATTVSELRQLNEFYRKENLELKSKLKKTEPIKNKEPGK